MIFVRLNPRSPRGERRPLGARAPPYIIISTRAPARGVTHFRHVASPPGQFQPALPARGATEETIAARRGVAFQPTLPARGATDMHRGLPAQMRYFNPRSPRGERLAVKDLQARAGIISTHAPREGSDRGKRHLPGSTWHFNPRSPRGERPTHDGHGRPRGDFNPRSPRGERHSAVFAFQLIYVFQPALPARGATSAPSPAVPV